MFPSLRGQDTRKEASLQSVPYPEGQDTRKEASLQSVPFLREPDTRKEASLQSVPYLEGRRQEAVPALSVICPSGHQDIDGHWFWKKKSVPYLEGGRHKKLFQL